MIEFIPVKEDGGILIYEAREGDEVTGRCEISFGGYDAKIISLSGDDITKEGLVRSGLNFCANKGAFLAHIDGKILCPALLRLGFSQNTLTAEIPDVLTSSCCSCRK